MPRSKGSAASSAKDPAPPPYRHKADPSSSAKPAKPKRSRAGEAAALGAEASAQAVEERLEPQALGGSLKRRKKPEPPPVSTGENSDLPPGPKLFVRGQSGNPGGRPKGSRNKLGEAFLADLVQLWEEHGEYLLAAAMREDPVALVKTIAQILPKEMHVKVGELEQLSEEELDARIAAEQAAILKAQGQQ